MQMDRVEFEKILIGMATFFDRQLSNGELDIYWKVLGGFSCDMLNQAINRHVKDPQHGRFMPKPADIIAQVKSVQRAQWDPPRQQAQLPASSPDRMRGPEVPVKDRLSTLDEYLALPAHELAEVGQTPESVATFRAWLGK